MVLAPDHVPNAVLQLPATITNGGSGPLVFDFDDRVIRLVKWQPSPHGSAATYAELAASRLAQRLGVPTVRGTIVYVPQAMAPTSIPADNQFHVGFTYLPGKNLHAGDFKNLANRPTFPAAAAFLAWLRVADQEGHNQYIWRAQELLPDGTHRDRDEMMLVDLSACFGGWEWMTGSIGQPDAEYEVPRGLAELVNLEDCERVIARIQGLDGQTVLDCFTGVPASWSIPADAAAKAADHLVERARHLEAVLQKGLAFRMSGS